MSWLCKRCWKTYYFGNDKKKGHDFCRLIGSSFVWKHSLIKLAYLNKQDGFPHLFPCCKTTFLEGRYLTLQHWTSLSPLTPSSPQHSSPLPLGQQIYSITERSLAIAARVCKYVLVLTIYHSFLYFSLYTVSNSAFWHRGHQTARVLVLFRFPIFFLPSVYLHCTT